MNFMILDNAGNAVEAFDSEQEAFDALVAMTAEDSGAAQQLAVLAFDDEGEAVGDALTVADKRPDLATRLVMSGDCWTQPSPLTVVLRRSSVVPTDHWHIAGAC